MKIGKYLPIVILICVGLVLTTADAQENLAQQASAIFQQNCLNCHGASGSFKEALLIDRNALVDTKVVIPGNPENSEFYKRLLGPTENGLQMPLNLPPLSPEAVETIARWITAGAPDWDVQHDINFITTDTILNTIRNHLKSLDPFDRPSARYFTMTHLYNAGESPETLSDYRIALSKLINSLSWKFEITNPTPIDEAQTIFYIDLRRYEWNNIKTDVWTHIEQAYPYNIAFDPETQAGLLEKLTQLQTETGSTVPFVHADWFLATASLPPLYHDILGLPQTDRVLETQLEVNVASNIRNAPGMDVWRAGFNDSGVSSNNRVVERHTSRYGAYWKSYDFAGSVGSQNIFTHPLDFTHDGGEIIFNLPNGLQAYFLVDANGNRLEDAPIDIVSNPAASDPTVRNGLSCIGCHTQGMKKFEDSVRAAIEQDQNPPYNKTQALRLYPEQSVLDELLQKDTIRFQQALEKIGGPFADDASRQRFFKQLENEPIQRFHEAFQAPLNASHAAAAVGLETEAFLTQISEKQSLKNLGLQTLTDENGTVKRDAWTSNFDDMISALNTPDSTLPPVVQRPERIPGAGVHIPDPNLRAVLTEVLGKAPGAPITAEEIATLTHLRPVRPDIQDLTGIQFATNLEMFDMQWSPEGLLSDLSPLAGLTKLKYLSVSGPSISDLSPLAGLINLELLALFRTSVSDLSPLAGLSKLEWLYFNHAPVSDLSPLAGLTNLETLQFFYAEGPSLVPLKELSRLKILAAGRSQISDISPLAGLINLEVLELFESDGISDISSLASMSKLRRLHLQHNNISDLSPLTSLHNLKWVHLGNNNISDISPLNELPADTNIIWYENPGFPRGGPKIEGPWLWAIVPGPELDSKTDFLSQASDGTVTELQIATHGAKKGESIGESVWTIHKIPPTGENNIGDMTNALGWATGNETVGYVLYGSILLNSPREQQTKIFVGANDGVKVWLNGQLIYKEFGPGWDPSAINYQHIVPITLNEGVNVLLVAVDNIWGDWSGFFGFDAETEYTVIPPGVGFTFSATETTLLPGDTFTLNLNVENVTDFAGWQADIAYDHNVLETIEVTESNFLKAEGGNTLFEDGTIDNRIGKITGLFSARISESGVSGTGTLLSVTFKAKAGGKTQVTLENFEFSSISGAIIPAVPADITITVGEYPAWDVNQDGRVSIVDMVLVAKDLGAGTPTNLRTDVNRDGVINIQDLIFVAQHLGKSTDSAAPSAIAIEGLELDPAMVQAWIAQAQIEDDGSIAFQQGITNLERLLALFIPENTDLLHNYPNPFNPETWIPYQLAEPAEVILRIYAVNGTLVRTLALGYQPAGIYQTRTRAAHWDGKNDLGESVASGVYFYTLTAGDFNATRKMLIRK